MRTCRHSLWIAAAPLLVTSPAAAGPTLLRLSEARNIGQQLCSLFALRLVENARTALDNLPVTDDQHIVRQAAHERQIVSHQQQRNAARALEACRSSTIVACTETSSAEVISSQMSTSGSTTSARAIATRWPSPPESSWG